jgi:uncharacterized protein (TIGR02588 family)
VGERRAKNVVHVPPWEWALGITGFAFVAATVAFLAYQAITDDHAPPDVAIRTESVAAVQSGYVVTIAAVNSGDRAAANVIVKGELSTESGTVETSEMNFQYLPARSERKGGLFFAHDPRRFKLVVSARGYERP